jgi:hypothetical protein
LKTAIRRDVDSRLVLRACDAIHVSKIAVPKSWMAAE